MKKYLSIICAIAMLASLTGCGSSGSDSDSKTKSSNISASETETTEKATEKEEPTPEQTTAEPTTEEVTEAPTEKPTEKITEPVAVTEAATKGNLKDLDNIDNIKVDNNIATVSIVMPAEFVLDANQTVEDGKKDGRFTSVVANDDGSVTFTMTKLEHTKFMREIKTSIDDSIENYISECQTITAIEPIDDYSGFNIHVTDPEEYKNSLDAYSIVGLVLASGIYGRFNGKDITMAEIQIHLFDANGNEFKQ